MSVSYPNTSLLINGRWRDGQNERLAVINPATEERIGFVAHASTIDLDEALSAAENGFARWRRVSALDRSRIMRKAADLLRQRADQISVFMTLEQGKPLAEARAEIELAADTVEWFAEEGRRTYGRLVPARAANVTQMVVKEGVGPVAAFTPWNFPVNQATRKVAAALSAGCSFILKGPEETPASCAALAAAFVDAGLPDGVLNLVFGVPAEISSYLISSPVIRKISFTGSTPIGKHLASLAGTHMKRVTMELGGHAPAIVFNDANVERAATILAANKYRNAGQVCVAPTRFLVQDGVYEHFVERFVSAAKALKVGDGMLKDTTMGPLANGRRLEAIEGLVDDARSRGAEIALGGERTGNRGYFYQPTVLTGVPVQARTMNDEPFGPVAIVNRFSAYEDAIKEANRLPFGLAAYAYTKSAGTMAALSNDIESGMLGINHHGIGTAELPFGGVKESGYGSEGGPEAVEAYLNTKLVTQHVEPLM
ncbi:MAG: NAD-dependent succinate-semialdehyde dehydrogenase [Bradyrhizobiaceae bacterium]|nr:MAG: NAD-dependent succinate-semialdehyde dehydrogenase [Bradyrhizobiaceae bacterium]